MFNTEKRETHGGKTFKGERSKPCDAYSKQYCLLWNCIIKSKPMCIETITFWGILYFEEYLPGGRCAGSF